MNSLELKLSVCDYEGNSQSYEISINLKTWEIEERKVFNPYENEKYAPSVQIKEVEIFMDYDLVEERLDKYEEEKPTLYIQNRNL